MAPEVLAREKYSAAADLWSLGMVIYEARAPTLLCLFFFLVIYEARPPTLLCYFLLLGCLLGQPA